MTAHPRPGPPGATAPARVVDTFIGIDPGLSGAIAVIHEEGCPLLPWIRPTPTIKTARGLRDFDRAAMAGVLSAFPHAFVAIERVNAAPMRGRRQGTTSMFNFGQGFGLWLGILAAQGKPFVEVYPQTWKARLLKGMGKGKAASIKYARLVEPLVDLRPTKRSRVDSSDFADALCIAIYARREWAIQRAVLASSGSFKHGGKRL